MRYLTVLVRPTEDETLHPLGERLSAEPSLSREAIHHVELLADGTVLLFGEGSGSRERYREIMAEAPTVVDYLVSGDDPWMAVSQFEVRRGARRDPRQPRYDNGRGRPMSERAGQELSRARRILPYRHD